MYVTYIYIYVDHVCVCINTCMYVYIYIYTHTPIAYYLPGLDRRALIAAAFLVGCDYDAGAARRGAWCGGAPLQGRLGGDINRVGIYMGWGYSLEWEHKQIIVSIVIIIYSPLASPYLLFPIFYAVGCDNDLRQVLPTAPRSRPHSSASCEGGSQDVPASPSQSQDHNRSKMYAQSNKNVSNMYQTCIKHVQKYTIHVQK